MAQQFHSFYEIMDYAIDREVNAQLFYKALARKADNPALVDLLEQFAEEEMKHRKKLAQVKQGKFKLLEGDMPTFGLGIADVAPDIEPSPEMSLGEALLFAMNKEKRAYRLYLELAMDAPNEQMAKFFMVLAHEEANHKVRLEIEFDNRILNP